MGQIVGSLVLAAAEPSGAIGLVTQPGPGWLALVPLLPLLGAVLCALTIAFRIRTKAPAWISVGLLGVGALLAIAGFVGWKNAGQPTQLVHVYDWIRFAWGSGPEFRASFGLFMDGLSWLWMLFVMVLGTLIALYSSEYMGHDVGRGYGRFFGAFCLFVFSMACLVMGDNLVLLYLGWEGVGLCSYLLIGYYYKRPAAVAAAKKAFIMNRIGDLGLALGIFLTFTTFGTGEYASLFNMVAQGIDGNGVPLDGRWETWVIPLLFTCGAFGKSAQLFFYVWLPDAMEGPTPVSALIHAATMVTAGVYLVARMFPLFLLDEARVALNVVAWGGTITALWAATIGMSQFDIKRIMGYSTVSQLGFMFAGLGVLTTTGGAYHVFTHAFFKAVLFLSCGAVMHGFAGQLDLRKLSGLWHQPGWRITSIAMLIGCINLAGVPFTAGYFSKDMILAEAFVTPGMAPIGWILLLTAGLTAYYTFRVFFRVFLGPVHFDPGDEVHAHDDHADAHGHGHDDHAHGSTDAHGAEHHDHAHDDAHGHAGDHGHEFHPHPPGPAINAVLVILAVGSILAAIPYFLNKDMHGWVGSMLHVSTASYHSPYGHHGALHDQAGTIFGADPHKAMYYISAGVGALGILVAFLLHYVGRREAATARADALIPALGPVERWARRKWYVDEFYNFLIVRPLWVFSNIFHIIDKLLVDGLVNLLGALPKWFARQIRPSQAGVLQSYAVGMAGGLAVILLIVWVLSR